MHNCKSTRDGFVELALNEMSPGRSAQVLAELKDCRECQEEFATIRSALRTSGQALQAALPAEDFWPGYHARLQTALANTRQNETLQTGRAPQRIEKHPPGTPPGLRSQRSARSTAWLELRSLLTTSVRVPAPVAAALVLLFGVSIFFAVHSRGAATPMSLTPTSTESAAVQTTVVEVPVIKEKVVTRIVYVEANGRRPRNAVNYVNDGREEGDDGNDANNDRAPVVDVTRGVARVRSDQRSAAMSLAGFKPTDEVKLTIIKGSDPK
jgi:anti-sigma factor RsiW